MEVTLDTIRDIKLHQPKNGYRFSIDAPLLYSFVNLQVVKRIADLGAGSGIIGILLAKKYRESHVVLFELQDMFVKLAQENLKLNGLEQRIGVFRHDIRDIAGRKTKEGIPFEGRFDLVVSNPPFRKPRTGLISPEGSRAIARHEVALKLSDIAAASQRLLRSRGRLCLVYHPSRLTELIDTLKRHSLEVKRLRFVHSLPSSEAKMVLVEAIKDGRVGLKIEKPLFVYKQGNEYTDEVREICYGTQPSPVL